ncbi:hypothetical protein ACH4CC_01880 [Streptomyces lydicus]
MQWPASVRQLGHMQWAAMARAKAAHQLAVIGRTGWAWSTRQR